MQKTWSRLTAFATILSLSTAHFPAMGWDAMDANQDFLSSLADASARLNVFVINSAQCKDETNYSELCDDGTDLYEYLNQASSACEVQGGDCNAYVEAVLEKVNSSVARADLKANEIIALINNIAALTPAQEAMIARWGNVTEATVRALDLLATNTTEKVHLLENFGALNHSEKMSQVDTPAAENTPTSPVSKKPSINDPIDYGKLNGDLLHALYDSHKVRGKKEQFLNQLGWGVSRVLLNAHLGVNLGSEFWNNYVVGSIEKVRKSVNLSPAFWWHYSITTAYPALWEFVTTSVPENYYVHQAVQIGHKYISPALYTYARPTIIVGNALVTDYDNPGNPPSVYNAPHNFLRFGNNVAAIGSEAYASLPAWSSKTNATLVATPSDAMSLSDIVQGVRNGTINAVDTPAELLKYYQSFSCADAMTLFGGTAALLIGGAALNTYVPEALHYGIWGFGSMVVSHMTASLAVNMFAQDLTAGGGSALSAALTLVGQSTIQGISELYVPVIAMGALSSFVYYTSKPSVASSSTSLVSSGPRRDAFSFGSLAQTAVYSSKQLGLLTTAALLAPVVDTGYALGTLMRNIMIFKSVTPATSTNTVSSEATSATTSATKVDHTGGGAVARAGSDHPYQGSGGGDGTESSDSDEDENGDGAPRSRTESQHSDEDKDGDDAVSDSEDGKGGGAVIHSSNTPPSDHPYQGKGGGDDTTGFKEVAVPAYDFSGVTTQEAIRAQVYEKIAIIGGCPQGDYNNHIEALIEALEKRKNKNRPHSALSQGIDLLINELNGLKKNN